MQSFREKMPWLEAFLRGANRRPTWSHILGPCIGLKDIRIKRYLK